MPVSTKSMVRWGFWGSLLLLTIAVGALRHHSGVRAYPHLQDVTPEKLPVYDVLVQAVGAIERFDKDAFLRLYRPGPEGGMRNALAGWYENKWLWRQKAQGIRGVARNLPDVVRRGLVGHENRAQLLRLLLVGGVGRAVFVPGGLLEIDRVHGNRSGYGLCHGQSGAPRRGGHADSLYVALLDPIGYDPADLFCVGHTSLVEIGGRLLHALTHMNLLIRKAPVALRAASRPRG